MEKENNGSLGTFVSFVVVAAIAVSAFLYFVAGINVFELVGL